MKIMAMGDAKGEMLAQLLRAIEQNPGARIADLVSEKELALLDEVATNLERTSEWTKESHFQLPVADFATIDMVARHADNFVVAQNKYNAIRSHTAAAITDFICACMGFKTRKA